MLGTLQSAVIPMFLCPSRRPGAGYPAADPMAYNASSVVVTVAKTDYAANGGSFVHNGPGGPAMGCLSQYPNCDWTASDDWPPPTWPFNGVCGAAQ